MTTGRLAYMPEPGSVELREYELPTPEPGSLLIETVAAGICGSDLHMFADKHPLKSIVLGHEVIGRVVDPATRPTDSAGRELHPGDLVSVVYFAFCQHCRQCARGLTHLCENAYNHWIASPDEFPHFTGTFGTHYYVGRFQHLFKVPDNVDPLAAVSANCALAQVSAGVDRGGVTAGDTVVIQGAGGLGLWGVAVAKERGAHVIVVDAVQRRLDAAKAFGADEVVSFDEAPEPGDRIARVRELTDGGADIGLELTGVGSAVLEGVEMVRPGATYVEIGNVMPGVEIGLDIGSLTRRSVTIHPVIRYHQRFLKGALDFISRNVGRLPFDQLVDATYPLDDVLQAMEDSKARKVNRAALTMGPDAR
ncbi:zinc-binding dehydrogenase [Pseudonocardia benzenivorans]|uniref:alcohol dehydrogenase n=1 Tax=Pseudonocardia benzenivorans TaxID=228005 RepID=A0ABW3VLE5_9PSEU|nr:zinc-binding alcohol dehydrogenase [Pseudonocardia sp. D17]